MVKSVIRLDPQGVKRVMEVGDPSASALVTTLKPQKTVKTKSNKDKPVGKSSILRKQPKHTLRSRRCVESDTSSSENSEPELKSPCADIIIQDQTKQPEPVRAKSVSPVICPSGNQNVTVTAEVHCSQGGTKVTKMGAQKPASSTAPSTDHPNMDEIEVAEVDDFTVVTAKKKPRKSKANPAITHTALNTPLPPSPNPETGSLEHNTTPFLTASRQKILPVVILHNFQGDMTRLNKDFHTKLQPIGFTTYRIKAGIACQSTTYKDYINIQTFLKQHKVPFNLIRHNDSKPHSVVIKGISPTTPPKAIQDELFAIGFNVQNVIPMTAWRDSASAHAHNRTRQRSTQPEDLRAGTSVLY
jgi:hypothetical protein